MKFEILQLIHPIAHAEALPTKYTLIQPVPGAQEVSSFPEYVGYLIPFALGLAALLAMLQIVWAGFKRASAVGNESEIKDSEDRIEKAIWGLLLALLAYLFLRIINPDLVNLRFFPEQVAIQPSVTETLERDRQICLAECPQGFCLDLRSLGESSTWSCRSLEEIPEIAFTNRDQCEQVCSSISGGEGCGPHMRAPERFQCIVVNIGIPPI